MKVLKLNKTISFMFYGLIIQRIQYNKLHCKHYNIVTQTNFKLHFKINKYKEFQLTTTKQDVSLQYLISME